MKKNDDLENGGEQPSTLPPPIPSHNPDGVAIKKFQQDFASTPAVEREAVYHYYNDLIHQVCLSLSLFSLSLGADDPSNLLLLL
jgi:hypothetical protein